MLIETFLRQQVEKAQFGVALIDARTALDIAEWIEKHRDADGHWEVNRWTSTITCSKCGNYWSILDNDTETFNYCPNCGARMDGERREDV